MGVQGLAFRVVDFGCGIALSSRLKDLLGPVTRVKKKRGIGLAEGVDAVVDAGLVLLFFFITLEPRVG